jgi:hypothetical protein
MENRDPVSKSMFSVRSKTRLLFSVLIAIAVAGSGVVPAHASTAVITYMSTGATSGSAPSSEAVARNSNATLKSPGSLAKTGFVFKGWSTGANGGGTYYPFPGTIAIANDDVTLYPAFGGTVTFNSSGGFGTPSSTSLEFVENRSFVLPSQGTMGKSNFNFSGWKDSTTSTSFAAPNSSFTLPSGRTSGTVLYAAWTRNVIFSLNGATIGSAPSSQVWLESAPGLNIPPALNSGIQRRGFDHIGWATSSNGRPISSFGFIPSNATTTLYAAWSAQPTMQRLRIDFKPRKAELTETAIARLEALKATLSPSATFPKQRIRIFLGSWRHSSQSANLGKKRIAVVRKILRDSGISAKFLSSNDSRSSGSTRDARNNRIDLISEWRN